MKQSAEPVTQRICRIVFQRNQIAVQIRPYSTTQMEWMVQPAFAGLRNNMKRILGNPI